MIDEKIYKVTDVITKKETNRMLSLPLVNRLVSKTCPDENSDRYFSVASACKGCATCQKICPVGNIVMSDGKPVFQHKCEHCLACLHNCPASAIEWKNKTQGKARYRNTHVSLEDLIVFNSR